MQSQGTFLKPDKERIAISKGAKDLIADFKKKIINKRQEKEVIKEAEDNAEHEEAMKTDDEMKENEGNMAPEVKEEPVDEVKEESSQVKS